MPKKSPDPPVTYSTALKIGTPEALAPLTALAFLLEEDSDINSFLAEKKAKHVYIHVFPQRTHSSRTRTPKHPVANFGALVFFENTSAAFDFVKIYKSRVHCRKTPMLFATQANVFDDFKDPEFAGLLIALRSRNNEHAAVEADQDEQEAEVDESVDRRETGALVVGEGSVLSSTKIDTSLKFVIHGQRVRKPSHLPATSLSADSPFSQAKLSPTMMWRPLNPPNSLHMPGPQRQASPIEAEVLDDTARFIFGFFRSASRILAPNLNEIGVEGAWKSLCELDPEAISSLAARLDHDVPSVDDAARTLTIHPRRGRGRGGGTSLGGHDVVDKGKGKAIDQDLNEGGEGRGVHEDKGGEGEDEYEDEWQPLPNEWPNMVIGAGSST